MSGRWDYSLSFHLETESGVPKDRLVLESEIVQILVRVFAIIGLLAAVSYNGGKLGLGLLACLGF